VNKSLDKKEKKKDKALKTKKDVSEEVSRSILGERALETQPIRGKPFSLSHRQAAEQLRQACLCVNHQTPFQFFCESCEEPICAGCT